MKKPSLLYLLLVGASMMFGCQGRYVEFVSNRPVDPPAVHRASLIDGASKPNTITVCLAEARSVRHGIVVWLSVAGTPAGTITDFGSITLSQALADYMEASLRVFDVVDSKGEAIGIDSPDPHESNWPALARVREYYRKSGGASSGPQFSRGQFVLAPMNTNTPNVFSQMLFLYCDTALEGATVEIGTSKTSLEAFQHIQKRIQSELDLRVEIIVVPSRVVLRPL